MLTPAIQTSIIVATYNGGHRMRTFLASIIPLLSPTRELVIVDDGSQDNTPDLVVSLTEGCGNVYLQRIDNSGRSVARNTGAKLAKGEFILFIDDDIELPADFMDRHEAIKRKFPDSWVTGTVRQKVEDIPHVDFLRFRRKLDYEPKKEASNELGLVEVESFSTQQLCVSADIFRKIGGFNEALRDCEDFELSVRVRDAGYRILHDTKNIVFHRDFSSFERFIKRQVEYRRGRMALAALNPEMVARFPHLFITAKKMKGLERLARKLTVYNFFWQWFFKSRLRYVLPERLLNLAYDLVMSSTFLLSPGTPIKPRCR